MALSRQEYSERLICGFDMETTKPVSTPLATHFKLSSITTSSTEDEREYISQVPYASVGVFLCMLWFVLDRISHMLSA